MADARTEALRSLLDASDPSTREAEWERFVAGYSGLIIHVARKICGDHDRSMDHYAYVLEQLRAEDFRRLRTFVADGRSELSTWLLVVAQRLCMDHHRRVYGRVRRNGDGSQPVSEDMAARQRLIEMIGAKVNLDILADDNGRDPEYAIRVDQMHELLGSALAGLGARQRLLIKLRFEDGLSMADVARSMEMPSRFHAYRTLEETLTALRRTLERKGVTDGAP